ncbi:hypothetical protein VQ042_00955 [Aurantimonas sp. A2-1-M11]|uniref:hypothetical protein n=1 Tax=Aurantimonas sp. A2-1-M11 TaxID=3113712 RepID=UPI002F947BC8
MKSFLYSLDRSDPIQDAGYRAGRGSLMIGMSVTDAYRDAVAAMERRLPAGAAIPEALEREIAAHQERIRRGEGPAIDRIFDCNVGRGR